MKKTIKSTILAAVLLMVGVSNTFAGNDEGVSNKVLNSFKKEFAQAKEVRWEISKAYVKATFNNNGQVMFAYYNESGDQLGISRNIVSANLPITLQNELKSYLSTSWISGLFEIVTSGETSFFVTLENADNVVILKSNGLNGWEVYKRNQK